jgi:3-deoxy-manno-octulosonate cytidylyltransferase (CMP-KDO synthetase)
MNKIGLIPARLDSTRLKNKPLELIEGYPMYFHVYNRAKMSILDDVYLCTDSKDIVKQANEYNIPTILTSVKHKNGTERCGEASTKLRLNKNDLIINIHGDEPLVDPTTINKVIKFFLTNKFEIVFPYLLIRRPLKNNLNSVKIVTNQDSKVIYMSRSSIPSDFSKLAEIKKQCGITAFTKKSLDCYNSLKPSLNEKIEKIELLRAVDNNLNLGSVLVSNESISVDTPEDLKKVRKLIKLDKIKNKYL